MTASRLAIAATALAMMWSVPASAEDDYQAAELSFPQEVPPHFNLNEAHATAKVHWKNKQPVVFDVSRVANRFSVEAHYSIYDEAGHEIKTWDILGYRYRQPPTGRLTVYEGDVIDLDLHEDGWADFEKPGTYYIAARFTSAGSKEHIVRFQTTPARFRVVAEAGTKRQE